MRLLKLSTLVPHLRALVVFVLLQASRSAVYSVLHDNKPGDWEPFGTSFYQFILDTERRVDETHYNADRKCRMRGGSLVSIETEDELAYIVRRIEKRVILIGEQFANEQWWTSGFRLSRGWLWDNVNKTTVALPSFELPRLSRSSTDQYLALSHTQDGWQLMSAPDNFKLRYICEKVNFDAHARPPEERLLTHLFQNYDTDARGYSGQGRTVNVSIRLTLLRIQDLDERRQVLTTMGLIIAEWNDARLRWMPDIFDNISNMVVRAERVWLPELAIMNGAEEHVLGDFDRVRVMLSVSGRVHWEPGGIFHTTCDVDMRYFPFDVQQCSIKVGAWAYYSTRMNLTSASPVVETADFSLNGEWDLLTTSTEWKQTTLPCCPDMNYPYVEFKLSLKRRHVFYVMNLILPCVLLSVLVMALFWVPPSAGEKITGGVAVVCAFVVFLLLLADIVPRTSLHVPIIVIYLTCTMGLGTLSVCASIIVIAISTNHPQSQPPKWLIVCFRLPTPKCESFPKKLRLLSRSESDDLAEGADCNLAEKGHYSSEEECTQNSINRQVAAGCKLRKARLKPEPSIEDIRALPPDGAVPRTQDDMWHLLAKRLDKIFFVVVFVLFLMNGLIVLLAPWHQG